MIDEKQRQTGRTTRIIDFIMEQLYSVGECIVTDHTVFEYPKKMANDALINFIGKTNKRLEFQTGNMKSCTGKILKAGDFKVVHFKLKSNEF